MRVVTIWAIALFAGCLLAQSGWRMEIDPAPWAGRYGHNVETFDGKLWVLNGNGGGSMGSRHDTWSSSDGANWVKEGDTLPWFSRMDAGVVVFQGRLWLLGGNGGGGTE
jgi:hypothetical protein